MEPEAAELTDGRVLVVATYKIGNANFIVGMYAIRALELLGPRVAAAEVETISAAQNSPYEFTRRIARRLTAKLESTASR